METVDLRIMGRFRTPVMRMALSATVLDLKKQIEAELHVDAEKQILHSDFHQEVMHDNDRSIGSYYYNLKGLSTDVTLTLKPEFKQIRITVRFESKEADLMVNEGDSVGVLKAKIEQLWGIPYEKIMLTYNNDIMVVNYLNLWEYYIGEADVIRVNGDLTQIGR